MHAQRMAGAGHSQAMCCVCIGMAHAIRWAHVPLVSLSLQPALDSREPSVRCSHQMLLIARKCDHARMHALIVLHASCHSAILRFR